jgi:ATP-dependent DNA helicase RecG
VFGVKETENGSFAITGVSSPDKVQNDFLTTLRGEKFNIQLSSKGTLIEFNGKVVIVFRIPEMPRQAKPVYFNGDIRNTYIRQGGTDQKATQEEIHRFLRDASSFSSDSLIVEDSTIADLDSDSISGYRRYIEAQDRSHPFLKLNADEFLRKLGCLQKDGITIAGLALFGKEDSISRRLPSFELNIYEMPEDMAGMSGITTGRYTAKTW